ncbi:MAG: cytochrome b [Fulvimarina manganoxydans]|uniref:cytochrome b n=1 Tax=Fulvimarina manganoxydans TaxID=937218 RepID=UPI002353EA32|nr:cytochrome b/b6 domain-containing protein [Fulvimarina manganoxydans]MCK5933829.1 cytochrome b [Fulvimarina manganoxydans]
MSINASRAHWTGLNVFLHWTIVVLVIGQWIEGEFMSTFWDGTLDGKTLDQTTVFLGYTHIVFGTLILVAAAVRLLDRIVNGRPPHPEGEPTWAAMLAKVTHVLLYAVLLVMPILGLAAWFTGNDELASYHATLWNPLLALIGLHVVGALAQHFWFKTGALKRMLPGVRHSA